MKNMMLERIYKRLLKEAGAPSVDGYGAVVYDLASGNIAAVVYDVPSLEDTLLEAFSTGDNKETILTGEIDISSSIVGYVNITKPVEACWDAYQIAMIAGPGKIVYGCAYAMSPNGRLISDRESMTPAAKSAWRFMAAKGTRGKKKLDNVYDPETPEPEDDCFLRDEDYLDYAYESEGWEKGMLDSMVAEHKALKSRLIKGGGAIAEFVERELRGALRIAGMEFFDEKYAG